MRRTSLPVLGAQRDHVSHSGSLTRDGKLAVNLGVLSIHFDGGRCHVRCPFCYLGEREGTAQSGVPLDLLQRVEISPASFSVLAIYDWGARVIRLNDTGELPPLA